MHRARTDGYGSPSSRKVTVPTFEKPAALTGTERLFKAIEENAVGDVRRLMSISSVDVNGRDRHGQTPLHVAIEKFQGEIARILLLNGADPTLENSCRLSPLDLVRDKEHEEISHLIYGMQTTMWRPGEDPDLLAMECETGFVDAKEREMLVLEKSQIKDILEDAALGNYFPVFEKNRMTFIQFLRVDEDCLLKMNISDSEDREKILKIVRELADRKWEKGSILPNFMLKNVSSYETMCILKNLQAHALAMKSGLDFVTRQIRKNPESLRLQMEAYSIQKICSGIDGLSDEAKVFIENIEEFAATVSIDDNSPEKTDRASVALAVGTCVLMNAICWAGYLFYKLRRK